MIRVTPITFLVENLTAAILMTSMSVPDYLTSATPTSTVADVDCLTEHDEALSGRH